MYKKPNCQAFISEVDGERSESGESNPLSLSCSGILIESQVSVDAALKAW